MCSSMKQHVKQIIFVNSRNIFTVIEDLKICDFTLKYVDISKNILFVKI